MIRAEDYVGYVMDAVGRGYVYGASGQICSLAFRKQCAEANPSQKTKILGVCEKWDGKRVWDCSGMMRGAWRNLLYYRSGYTTSIYEQWCSRKGTIESFPEQAGTFVLRGTEDRFLHIGTYVGNGMVVDARGSREGVLCQDLDAYPWTHWAQADEIDFSNSVEPADERPALWTGAVRTKTGHGISLWTGNEKSLRICGVPEGAFVDVLEDSDDQGFANCRYGRRIGHADLQYVIPSDGEEPTAETARAMVLGVNIGLNLRTDPSYDRNTLVLLPNGAVVEVFETRDVFARVRYEGNVGWATSSYLKPLEA